MPMEYVANHFTVLPYFNDECVFIDFNKSFFSFPESYVLGCLQDLFVKLIIL